MGLGLGQLFGRAAEAAPRGKPVRRAAGPAQPSGTGESEVALEGALPAVLGRPSPAVPEALKPWVPWVLHGQEAALCPFLHGQGGEDKTDVNDQSGVECAWPARLSLQLRDKGGTFTQSFRLYKRGWVVLPGDGKAWPQEVKVDGQPAVVATPGGEGDDDSDDDEDAAALPQVLLRPGEHTVTGTFLWDEIPESLRVPPATGLVTLSLGGKEVPQPTRDAKGRVFLQKTSSAVEEDVLDVTVHRRIVDEIPLQLITRIELRVSGKSREVLLGRTLTESFIPMSLDSGLPARLEPDSRLRVQVRPGTYTLTLTARHAGPAQALHRPDPQGLWATDEVWVMDARPALRVVSVEGVATLDPQQTTLPDDWKKLPCYRVRDKDTVELKERQRGDSAPAPDRLTLHRELYLDFSGEGYTVSDRITGTLTRTWRLEVNAPTELGRVAVDGRDQLITRGKGEGGLGRAGVELRQGQVRISADSRIPRQGPLPAVSWNADFHQVGGVLHLPPGWRLLHMSGADDVKGTWLRHYTLLDLFLVLIVAMAIWRLFGAAWGGLALVALLLICPETDAPRWIWLLPLLVEGLSRVLPGGTARGALAVARATSRVLLALLVLVFAAQQLRYGLYPALERAGEPIVEQNIDNVIDGTALDSVSTSSNLKDNEASGEYRKADSDEELEQQNQDTGGAPPGKAEPAKREAVKKIAALNQSLTKTKAVPDVQMAQQRADQSSDWLRGKGKLYKGRKNTYEYDPQAVVQTGPGMPRWRWHQVPIEFSGPVDHDQALNLWLMSPLVNLVLAWVQVLLLALLTLKLCGFYLPGSRPRPGSLGMATMLAVLALSLGGPGTARAELPSKELLEELRARLLAKPECRPYCASSPRLRLEVKPRSLVLRMEVGTTAETAVPLPGGASQWLPEQVLVDGQPAKALLSREDRLWLVLPEGSHLLQLEGRLASRETIQIALPLKSHRVEATVEGWQLEGLHEDGLADDNLQLTRAATGKDKDKPAEASAALQAGALPPLVRVEREVQIGMLWQADTRVVRETPPGSAVVLEVPLLPGESITTADVRVQNGKALVNMAPTVTEVSWHSLLQERPQLELVAAKNTSLTEVWRLSVSPIFHVELSGIPVVRQQDSSGTRLPEWRPWPEEKVTVAISRPEGVTGRTLTIDHSVLSLTPGQRTTDATLTMRVRSSRGGQHIITLPETSQVQLVKVMGREQPIQKEGQRLILQLTPGSQEVVVQWRQSGGLGVRYLTPEVDLGAPSVNAELRLELGRGHWVLLCGGPRLGPAVLFWSLLLALALLSLMLGRIAWTPLRAHHWLLLGIGLTQVSLWAAAVLMVWPLLLGWRAQQRDLPSRRLFNLRQLLLFWWTVAAMAVLVGAIHTGLLGLPDMQIAGNGSDSRCLRWFLDRTQGPLPLAFAVSVPLLVYRLAMLLWALWIALALLGWLSWGYSAFASGGLWRRRPALPPVGPAGPGTPPSAELPAPPSPAINPRDEDTLVPE